jgi:hypothetical protein
MYAISLVGMWFIDVIWLALWAHRIDAGKVRREERKREGTPTTKKKPPTAGRGGLSRLRTHTPPLPSPSPTQDLVFYPSLAHATEATQPLHNKYTTVPRFLLAMECLLFILRPAQILLWWGGCKSSTRFCEPVA